MVKVFFDWINEVLEVRIYEIYNIDFGDFYRIFEFVDWLMYFFIEFYKFFELKEDVFQYFCDFYFCLRYGVREEFFELVKLFNIGWRRVRVFYNVGFRSVEDILRVKLKDFFQVEGIGLKIIEGIYRYFGVEYIILEKEKLKKRKGNFYDFFKQFFFFFFLMVSRLKMFFLGLKLFLIVLLYSFFFVFWFRKQVRIKMRMNGIFEVFQFSFVSFFKIIISGMGRCIVSVYFSLFLFFFVCVFQKLNGMFMRNVIIRLVMNYIMFIDIIFLVFKLNFKKFCLFNYLLGF